MSHVIPLQLVQKLKSLRWNCNVFERSQKMTVGNYVRNLSGPGPAPGHCSQAPRLKARPCPPVPPHPPAPSHLWCLECCCVGSLDLCLAFGTKFSLLGVVLTKAVQNSPCMQKKRLIGPFRVSGESFVPDMWRGWVCGESFVPDMWRGWVCWESFVPEGPGAVVVGRIMSCPGVVLAPVGGLWQRPAAAHGHCGWALRVRRCPPHQWGPVADG